MRSLLLRVKISRSYTTRANRFAHLTDSALQSSKYSTRHDVVSDVEFGDFRNRRNRPYVPVGEPVPGGDV